MGWTLEIDEIAGWWLTIPKSENLDATSKTKHSLLSPHLLLVIDFFKMLCPQNRTHKHALICLCPVPFTFRRSTKLGCSCRCSSVHAESQWKLSASTPIVAVGTVICLLHKLPKYPGIKTWKHGQWMIQWYHRHEDPFQDAGLSKRFKKAEFGQDGQVVLIAQFYDWAFLLLRVEFRNFSYVTLLCQRLATIQKSTHLIDAGLVVPSLLPASSSPGTGNRESGSMCVLNAFKKWCAKICLILSWVPRLSPIFTEHSEASISFNLKLLLAAQGKLLVIRSNGPRVVQFRCAPWIAVKTGQLSKLMLQHLRWCVITTLSNRQAVLKCMVRHLNSLDISTMTLVHVIAGRTLVKELAKMEECSWDGIQGTLLFPAGDLKDTLLFCFVIFHNDSGIYIYIYTWTFDRINMMKLADP